MVLKRQLPSRVQSGANAQPEGVAAEKSKIENAQTAPAAPVETPAAMQVIREDLERAAALLQVADEQNFAPAQPVQPAPAPEFSAGVPAQTVAVAAEPQGAESPPPAQVVAAPASMAPSRPDNAHVLRRRDARPRNLNLKPAPAIVAPPAPPAEQAADAVPSADKNTVPINTTPLSEVDDRLMEAGILPRVVDKLDAKRPAGAAETGVMPVAEAADIAPLDFTLPVPQQAAVQAAAAAPMAPALEVPDLPAPAFASQPQETAPATQFDVPPPAIFASEEPAAAPAPAAAPPAMPEPVQAAPAQFPEPVAPASDLPWAQAPAATMEAEIPASPAPADNGWTMPMAAAGEVDGAAALHRDNAPPAPPLDVFKTLSTPDTGATLGAPLPTFPRGGGFPPPELPGTRARTGAPMNRPSGSSLPLVAGAAVVVLAVLGAYWWVGRSAGTPLEQQMAAITNQQASGQQPSIVDANLGSGISGTILQPPVDPATAGQGTFQPIPPATGNAVVNFADVPPADVNKPIVADGTEKMPDELGLVATFQQAVAAEKAKQKNTATQGNSPVLSAPAIQPNTAVAVQKEVASDKLKQDLTAELAAYRQALAQADSVAASPKPSEFFADPKAYMGKAPGDTSAAEGMVTTSTSGDSKILPPPTGAGLPPSELYTNNPNNLPLIPEPTNAAAQKVRTLEDFNVAAFEPEQDRVRIPRGLKPRVSLSEFPEMDVLSFVPGKGLIALYQGNEGVLLLGESLEGWELVGVNADNAEFRKGQKTNYVSAE